jgi:raffinose/stachyose/melibiose transport system permease protein
MTGRIDRTLNYIILVLFSVIALYPIVGIVLVALHSPGDAVSGFSLPDTFSLHNFTRAWSEAAFSSYLKSSAIVAVAVVSVSTLLAVLGGYAFGTMRFRGDSLLFYILILGLIVPYETTIIPLYYDLRSLGLTDTYWSLILPQIGFSMPFGIFWMRAFFLSAPRSLIEAARIDGASSWSILWRVLLPFGRPALLTLIVLLFMWTWNEFLLALVMVSEEGLRTAPLGLAFFQTRHQTDVAGLAAAAVIIALPVVLAYVVLQRHFIKGMMSGANKG